MHQRSVWYSSWHSATTKVVANAATAAARQLMSSGSKAMRRNKNQGLDATEQHGDVSTTANAPSASAPDNSNSSANTTQEYGATDSNALMYRRTLSIWLLPVNPILLITNIKLEKE